ncbi:hypothetical protein SAMN05444487_10415 [Marininema mesophilum]|uniref:Uncharacterized protein n=1 Tax=Marininema mesophilum TaxID=1048340 RepID=A0A1H2U6X3_9BACL|nr:hypothetical protein [Marininema mesophilum]SDW51677.1 hypothetical protein SAMN05444487_10415 [Marininema mesophilum]
MNLHFSTQHQYVFIHENVKHLFLLWPKENKRQLFIAEEQGEDLLLLTHPGETYEEMVLAQVEPYFFQRLVTGDDTLSAVLGATLRIQTKLYGLFYDRDSSTGTYFFELAEDELRDIPEVDYENIARTFLEEFPEYIANEDV